MDKRTKFKVAIITIIGVLIAFLYINRRQLTSDLIRDFEIAKSNKEWEKEDAQGQLIQGRKQGEWTTYFKNGQLALSENYKNDTLHGRQIYYTPEGQFHNRANYNMGIKVDSLFMYTGNGELNLVEFRDSTGKLQGPFKVYDTNGQIIQTGQYIDGKFDGEFRSFFRTGELKSIQRYLLNERVGKWIELSEKGDTIKIVQH